VNHTRI